MKYILFAILIYALYQFIFKLVIPVYQTTQKIKKGFKEMNENMHRQHQQNSTKAPPQENKPKRKVGDYIDFEEVK